MAIAAPRKVGNLFAPIVSLWFIALASVGIWNISQYPEIFKAYNPYYAFDYFIRKQDSGFTDLGGVLLAITGVEALFADLGHFNRTAIKISFPCFVYFPLVLVYTGQAARLVLDPSVIANTFWLTTPNKPAIYWIVFVLAILATIIASQAMISATFSLVYQSMQLDCFPAVKEEKIVSNEINITDNDINSSHEITLESGNEVSSAIPRIIDINDRFIVKKVKNYEGCYQVTARYGYAEQISQGREFILQLVESIRKIDPASTNLTQDFNPDNGSVVYVLGQQYLCSRYDSPWWTRILVNIYTFIAVNSRSFYSNWDIPVENTVVV
ncbi:14068_t:CDS:2, partial [Racocetra fulgida]